jgi:serine/threonine-protein kinase
VRRERNIVLLLSDMKGFTARTSRQTREENARMLVLHDALLLPVVRGFGGRKVKAIGDAVLAAFDSPTDAVLCAMAIQDRLAAFNSRAPERDHIEVRLALSQGEVRVERGDVHGEPVRLALVACALADAGEVVLTDAVYLSMNKSEAATEVMGSLPLPGGGKVQLRRALRGGDPAAPYDAAAPYGGRALARLGKLPDPSRAYVLWRAGEAGLSFARKRIVWAAAALLLIAAAAGERGAREPEDPLRRAAELVDLRQPVAALSELDRLAETSRAHDPRVEVVRGKAEHALGQFGLAFSDFAEAAQQDPRALDGPALAALADELDSEAFPGVWRPALIRLLGETVGRPAAAAVRPLLTSQHARSRDDALEVLELAGAATDEERLAVATADLADERAGCAAHERAVQRIVQVNDPGSEKLLTKVAWGTGCGGAQARDAIRRYRRAHVADAR